jgi:MFS family permease
MAQRLVAPLPARRQIAISVYWFALSFQGSALLTIVIPAALDRLAYGSHTLVLSRLAVLGAIVAMVLPPIAGAFSDAVKRRGGRRLPMLLWGTAVNVLGLLAISAAGNLYLLAGGFLIIVLGQNLATAAYQAVIPDMVPEGQWGSASGYMGVFRLLGTIGGLAVAGLASTHAAYYAMAATTAAGALYTSTVMVERADAATTLPHATVRSRRDFLLVFSARFAVMLGQTFLMTFAFYFFQDVLHAARPQGVTALFSGLGVLGAVLSSLVLGFVSDRSDRPGIVFLAGIPMAVAVGGFALLLDQKLLLLFALLYGLGYGAYLSVDWALALDAIPDLSNVARDLGVWGIASNLPLVLAPAIGGWVILHSASPATGYRLLFLVSAAVTLAGSLIVLGVRSRRRVSFAEGALRLAAAVALRAYVSLKFRVQVIGRLPRRRGATLVVANHGHPLEGALVPQILYWFSPFGSPLYCAGSERIFEPGFLADRGPLPVRRLLKGVGIGKVVTALGVRPIDNMTRERPFVSLAYELYRRHGDLPLRDVFTEEALHKFLQEPGSPGNPHLRDAWRSRVPASARTLLPFSALREPYRSEARRHLRPRIEEQLAVLSDLLRTGGTLYLTPEGRISENGRMSRLRLAYDVLRPLAEVVYIAAASYDPFRTGPLHITLCIEALDEGLNVRTVLPAKRPITASQLLATALLRARSPEPRKETEQRARKLLAALPQGAVLCPTLRQDPDAAIKSSLDAMLRAGLLTASGEDRLHLAARRLDWRFPHVPDIVAHQAAQFTETVEALRRLSAPKVPADR